MKTHSMLWLDHWRLARDMGALQVLVLAETEYWHESVLAWIYLLYLFLLRSVMPAHAPCIFHGPPSTTTASLTSPSAHPSLSLLCCLRITSPPSPYEIVHIHAKSPETPISRHPYIHATRVG